MPDISDYSNYNESVAAAPAGMNNQHIRLNKSAPPFEGTGNGSAVICDTQSKGPSPAQSEEWNRKKKLRRAENVLVMTAAPKSEYHSNLKSLIVYQH